jgi:hypothetical protein
MSKEYFSHDYNARTDPKLVRMVMKTGLDSLAIYWCIIEMLYEQEGYVSLDYIDNIAFELHTQSDRIADVLKNYDLFRFEDDKIYSESVLRRLALRDEISRKNSENAKSGWQKRRANDTDVKRPHSDRNAIKVNKSKVNNIKEKKIESIFIPEFLEFQNYALENEPNVNIKKLELKYKSWVVSGWKDGNGKLIKNWKSKLLNTLPYIEKMQVPTNDNVFAKYGVK